MECKMNTKRVLNLIGKGDLDRDFIDIYVDVEQLEYQKDRYQNAIMKFMEQYGDADIQIFSASGRSEIGGNHTDHQHGKVLACAINKDVIGIVKKESTTENKRVEEEVNTLIKKILELKVKNSLENKCQNIFKIKQLYSRMC